MVKSRWKSWDYKNSLLAKCLVAFLFPFLLCFFYCKLRGIDIFSLYLPNSINNDCLFYYKMVEPISSIGLPKGFFGFNESRAFIGSFAAWSPAILIPWIIWSIFFGWSYSSVFLSNVVYFSISLCIFVFLTKIEWKNILAILVVFSLYPSLPIHLLSALPETVLGSICIIYVGLAIRAIEENFRLGYVIPIYILSIYLTVCRPYMVVLILLPGIFLCQGKRKGAVVISALAVFGGVGLYFVISGLFTSSYFSPLYDLSIIKNIFTGNLKEAVNQGIFCLQTVLYEIWRYIAGAFSNGLTAGTQYVIAIVTALLILLRGWSVKNDKTKIIEYTFIIGNMGILLGIIFFLRKANEGGRHIWVFAVIGCVLCFCRKWDKLTTTNLIVLVGCLGVFILQGAMIPTDYDVPCMDQELKGKVEYLQKCFENRGICVSDQLSYDNTCLWVLGDDGGMTNHKELFALPKGMGISCCMPDYVIEYWGDLKCKYIATTNGGYIDRACKYYEYTEIGRTEDIVIYCR